MLPFTEFMKIPRLGKARRSELSKAAEFPAAAGSRAKNSAGREAPSAGGAGGRSPALPSARPPAPLLSSPPAAPELVPGHVHAGEAGSALTPAAPRGRDAALGVPPARSCPNLGGISFPFLFPASGVIPENVALKHWGVGGRDFSVTPHLH